VAIANRILERMGLSHAFGHASARIPGTNTFLMPTRRSPGLAEAGELLVIDTEGRLVSGEGEPNSEFWIHARMYAAREDVGGVVHAHPPACVCLTQIGEPHRVVHNQGAIFSRACRNMRAWGSSARASWAISSPRSSAAARRR
jgi:L-fuculose-phosphate aldolase